MEKLYIGVLSGTSLNSIDAVAAKVTAAKLVIVAALSYPMPIEFKNACLHISRQGATDVDQLGELDQQAGVLFAKAVNALLRKYNISPSAVKAIGSHGQTIRHRPDINTPFSMQIGDPNIIAQKTKITTVADFRRRDIAAGGQGAPLAPGFHAAMFKHSSSVRTIINIGGISNITLLKADTSQPIIGFDIGPGNCLMDYWCKQYFNYDYDQDGSIALQGKVIHPLLDLMLEDQFFSLPPPKTTGLEYFNPQWLESKMQQAGVHDYKKEDVLTTLTMLTSAIIGNTISSLADGAEVYLCGGGAYNQALVKFLEEKIKRKVNLTSALGIEPEWVEAGLFAWLAQQCLLSKPGNIPSVTGAKQEVILGGIYQ